MKFWLRLSATILLLRAKKPRTFHIIQEVNLFRGPKTCNVPLVKSPQFRMFDGKSTVLVASWIEERFDKDWWQCSSIDYSVV
jgi:hypothetical protein